VSYSHIFGDMMKVVLDTNVLVAASRSRQGASFALLEALRQRRFTALVSVALLLEYEAVLKRPEQLRASGRTLAMVEAFLDALCGYVAPVRLHYLWRPQTRDAADEMVLETALNGRAQALVSLNTADFSKAAGRFGLPLMTPGQFYRQHLHDLTRGE
jgi:putative PIN family toxin of toxin-antitoxin system